MCAWRPDDEFYDRLEARGEAEALDGIDPTEAHYPEWAGPVEDDRVLRSRARANAHRRAFLTEVRSIIRAAKGDECSKCGGVYPAKKLHFHHRDPAAKSFRIANFPRWGSFSRLPELYAEFAKCDVLCHPCHSAIHAPTHCPRSHPYSAENTYVYRGRRNCRECARAKNARRRAEQRAVEGLRSELRILDGLIDELVRAAA